MNIKPQISRSFRLITQHTNQFNLALELLINEFGCAIATEALAEIVGFGKELNLSTLSTARIIASELVRQQSIAI